MQSRSPVSFVAMMREYHQVLLGHTTKPVSSEQFGMSPQYECSCGDILNDGQFLVLPESTQHDIETFWRTGFQVQLD